MKRFTRQRRSSDSSRMARMSPDTNSSSEPQNTGSATATRRSSQASTPTARR